MSKAPHACVCLGKSIGCQATYVGVTIFVMLLGVLSFFVEGFVGLCDVTGCAGRLVAFLAIIISGSIMSISRLILRGMCGCTGLDDVPTCCPCNCFTSLDLAYYIWFGWTAVLGTIDMVFKRSTPHLRMHNPISAALVIAAIVCTTIKLCVMAGFCCPELLPEANADQQADQHCWGPTPGQVVIVGQPVEVGTQKVVVMHSRVEAE